MQVSNHPTHTALKCVDCDHRTLRTLSDRESYCEHPAMPVSVSTGYPLVRCSVARLESPRDAEQLAQLQNAPACGPLGVLHSAAHAASEHHAQPGEQLQALAVGEPVLVVSGGDAAVAVEVYALSRGVWPGSERGKLTLSELAFEVEADGEVFVFDPTRSVKADWLAVSVDGHVAAIGASHEAVGQPDQAEVGIDGRHGDPLVKTAILSMPQGSGKTLMAAELAARLGCKSVVDYWTPTKRATPGALHLTHIPIL